MTRRPTDLSPYVLTTPVRDEMDSLPALLAAIEAQAHRPAAWVVVDDGSTDGSDRWLELRARGRPWMEVVAAEDDAGEYLGAHVARIKGQGVRRARTLARERGVEPAYAAVLDADLTPAPDYYAEIVARMRAEARAGVASGVVTSPDAAGEARVERFQRSDLPRGGLQVLAVDCLEEIGGLPPYPGYDGVTNVLARLRGWSTHLYPDLVVPQSRETATRHGVARGYFKKGQYTWFLDLHPALVAARGAAYLVKGPRAGALPFLAGWARGALRGDERCPHDEVRRYYRRERPREYVRMVVRRLTGREDTSFV